MPPTDDTTDVPSGVADGDAGAPASDGGTQDRLSRVTELSDEELSGLEQDLVGQFDAADEADDLDAMSAAADQIDQVRAEIERRGSDAEEEPVDEQPTPDETSEEPVAASILGDREKSDGGVPEEPEGADRASESVNKVNEEEPQVPGQPKGSDVDKRREEAPTEPEGADRAAESVGDDTRADTDSSSKSSSADDGDGGSTTASASAKEDNVDIPEDRQPVPSEPATVVTAGADLGKWSAGTPFKDRMDLAKAMEARINSLRGVRSGDGQQHIVATLTASFPEDRVLEDGKLQENMRKIDNVTGPEPIMAAGGWCAPLETRYDLWGAGITDRPVKAALAGFNAQRGGIRFVGSPVIEDFAAGISLWTAANDANPVAPATKPCYKVECQPEVTALVDAVTLCLEFGNLQTRAFPELIDRNNQLALVAHARFAEQTLLNKMTALSTAITSGFKLGVARDFLFAVGRAASAYRHRFRMNPTETLRVLAPAWVKDAVREDIAWTMPGQNGGDLGAADNVIDGYLRARHVNISWHLDDPNYGAEEVAASAVDDFPGSFSWFIYPEGSFLFLDGGTLDLGVVRDSDLVSTNDYKTFTESFEGVARIGGPAYRVTTTTKVAGAVAGTVDTVTVAP